MQNNNCLEGLDSVQNKTHCSCSGSSIFTCNQMKNSLNNISKYIKGIFQNVNKKQGKDKQKEKKAKKAATKETPTTENPPACLWQIFL